MIILSKSKCPIMEFYYWFGRRWDFLFFFFGFFFFLGGVGVELGLWKELLSAEQFLPPMNKGLPGQ